MSDTYLLAASVGELLSDLCTFRDLSLHALLENAGIRAMSKADNIEAELLHRFAALEAENAALKARLAEAERHLEWAGPEVRAWQSLYPDQTTNKERERVEHIDAFLNPQPTAEGDE